MRAAEIMYNRIKRIYENAEAGELDIDAGALAVYAEVLALYSHSVPDPAEVEVEAEPEISAIIPDEGARKKEVCRPKEMPADRIAGPLPQKYRTAHALSNISLILRTLAGKKLAIAEIRRLSGVNRYVALEYLNMLARLGHLEKETAGGETVYFLAGPK